MFVNNSFEEPYIDRKTTLLKNFLWYASFFITGLTYCPANCLSERPLRSHLRFIRSQNTLNKATEEYCVVEIKNVSEFYKCDLYKNKLEIQLQIFHTQSKDEEDFRSIDDLVAYFKNVTKATHCLILDIVKLL